MIVSGSISEYCGQSRLCHHPLGRNYKNPAAHLSDQLAQIVEQVIDLRMAQVSEFEPTRGAVQPPGNLAGGGGTGSQSDRELD